jgi:hypothetical protein
LQHGSWILQDVKLINDAADQDYFHDPSFYADPDGINNETSIHEWKDPPLDEIKKLLEEYWENESPTLTGRWFPNKTHWNEFLARCVEGKC